MYRLYSILKQGFSVYLFKVINTLEIIKLIFYSSDCKPKIASDDARNATLADQLWIESEKLIKHQ